jgi:hypothetical protein
VIHNIENSTPLAELLASQNEEIAKHKWLVSQRLGADVGWARASEEWFEKHLADWVQAQRRLIDEALCMTDHTLTAASVQRVREYQSA